MISPELLSYIDQARKFGQTDQQIVQALVAQGWASEDVQAALQPGATPVLVAPSPVDSRSNGGEGSTIPPEIKGWNWGAAGLTWIWGIRFKVWMSFLMFAPIVGGIWWIVLGMKGSEWAWQHNAWAGVDQYKKEMKPWKKWGIIVFMAQIIFGLAYIGFIFSVGFFSFNSSRSVSHDAARKSDVAMIKTEVTLYADDHNGAYPSSLSDLTNVTLPQPPNVGETYSYTSTADQKHYLIVTKLEKTKDYFYVSDVSSGTEVSSAPTCSATSCP